MSLIQLYVPTESARDVVYRLGLLGLIHLRDLNSSVSAFQRDFVLELRVLDNILRQFAFFKEQCSLRDIQMAPLGPDTAENDSDVIPQSAIDAYANDAQFLEERVGQLAECYDVLETKNHDLIQFRRTVETVDKFLAAHSVLNELDAASAEAVPSTRDAFQLEAQPLAGSSDGFIAGVVDSRKVAALQQILWRVLRGNLYYHTEELVEPIYDPLSQEKVFKNVFVIFAHGQAVQSRIRKICESLDANIYRVDGHSDLRRAQLVTLSSKLDDLETVLSEANMALASELAAIARDLPKWWEIVAREKAVYLAMNLCDYDEGRKTLIVEGWVPSDEIDSLQSIISSSQSSETGPTIISVLQTSRTPPTFHRTNKFTAAFQGICDAYGIATYREINPGLPTIITFPFMFAIMFGDMGHGFLLTLAAGTLVYHEKALGLMKRDEIFDMAYTGRYILLLMGVFSMYTGLLYNDLFSKSMTLFKSAWEWPTNFQPGDNVRALSVGVYVFGLDYAWHGAENALLFTNSYKMKLSILMGYMHMTYSYMFSLANYIYFGSIIDVVGNFIPGLLFMQGIFGYLSLCVVYKWTIDWFAIKQQPPGLLNMLISMFLSPGTVAEPLYDGQAGVQKVLLAIALLCVPWLLLVKPLYFRRKFAKEAEYIALHQDEDHAEEHVDDDEHHEEHTFGDIMIHQVIHTIEFCLNCVSHTASYLRLWALSLAHAQLSTVLWTMTIGNAFGMSGLTGVIMTVILFAMWFTLTVVILVVMEGTSAMLHSLRLHWVELMSKYFEGEGHLYEPFGFKDLLDGVF